MTGGMYSSLRKIDMVIEQDGQRVFVQTDHRDTDEVAADLELSIIFALTRTLAPLRMKDAGAAVVRYVTQGELHPVLAEVLASTGAEVEAVGQRHRIDVAAPRTPAELADCAFGTLGARLLAEHSLSADEAGLVAYAELARAEMVDDEDDTCYWTGVVRLAAVTGEVLRASYGGRWIADPNGYSDIPFVFEPAGDAGMVNPVGKTEKYFMHGDAESPSQLLRAMEDRGGKEGPMLVSIKPSSWGSFGDVVGEPMCSPELCAQADVPFVAYGMDQPNTFAIFMKLGDKPHRLEDVRLPARANLRKVDVTVEKIELDGLSLYAVQGSYFAAEKILDQVFMEAMQEQLGTALLAVAIPEKGRMLVMNAIGDAAKMESFAGLSYGIFRKNAGGRQITPTVFLLDGGKITGVVAAKPPETPPRPKKGFFRRLFS